MESNKRSLNQRKTRIFSKIKYQPRRNTSNGKKKNTNRQEINQEFQPPRQIFTPRETPSASSRESSSERPRSRERDQQNTTTKRPTYAEILSRPKSQNQQTRPRRQISFQRERRENRSVQFRKVNGELEEGKSEGWIQKNYQTATVGNRDSGQLLEKALERHPTKHPSYRKTRRPLKQFRTLRDPSGGLVNLSNKLFTHHEFKLLNKGLSFCPTPQQYNCLNFNKDLQPFFRRIKLRAYFGINNTDREPTEEEIFSRKEKSNWTPNQNSHTVDTFIAAVTNDIS